MSVDEATAFGLGFGAFEAILIAVPSLMQIVVFILNSALLGSMPDLQREMLEAQLGLPRWIVAAPIVERIFTVFAHVFATLLVFISVARGKLHFFLQAFFYKSLLDAAVPYIQVTLRPSVSPTRTYPAEVWVVAIGLMGLAGTRWAKKMMFKSE